MKRRLFPLVLGVLILWASPLTAEVISQWEEVPVPENCGALTTETEEGCTLCHTPDAAPEDPLIMESYQSATADTMTYKTIISEDSKIYAQIPSKSVAEGRSFHIQNWIDGYAMIYDFTMTSPAGTTTVIDSRWPWGVLDPIYNYDHTLNTPGKWSFKIRIIYCSSGAPICGHGWIESTLEWTVTVGTDYCTIPSIPYFHQGDARWGNDEYAYSRPSNLFRTYGCAVTSTAMVLRRFGINYAIDDLLVYPGTLNSWLASNEGYVRGSEALIWNAVEEYSRPAPGGTTDLARIDYRPTEAVNLTGNGCIYAGSTGDMCATYSRRIDDYICSGIPVMLRVESLDTGRTHFLLAQNQGAVGNTRTLEILDPSRPNDTSRTDLIAYSNRFTGYRIFTAATEDTDPTSIVVYLGSPAHIRVTDPYGAVTGWDPVTGEVLMGIPDSNYLDEGVEDQETWALYVDHPTAGTYDVRVTGTGTGEFTLGVVTVDQLGRRTSTEYAGETIPGREYDYEIGYSPEPGGPGGISFNTYEFLGFGPPMDRDEIRVFKMKRTIPIKFAVRRRDGGAHDDIVARLSLQQLDNSTPTGDAIEPDPAGSANLDGLFRYDPIEDQYIYNLGTSNLSVGSWEAVVRFDDGSSQRVLFGLK